MTKERSAGTKSKKIGIKKEVKQTWTENNDTSKIIKLNKLN